MDRLLGYLRQDFGKRHACLSKQPDGQEVLLFKAMGRNGNWPMEITLEEDGEVMSICSMLPLTITPARRQAIAELVTRLNDAADKAVSKRRMPAAASATAAGMTFQPRPAMPAPVWRSSATSRSWMAICPASSPSPPAGKHRSRLSINWSACAATADDDSLPH